MNKKNKLLKLKKQQNNNNKQPSTNNQQTTINNLQTKQRINHTTNNQTKNSVRFENNVDMHIYEQVDVMIEELGSRTSWIQVALDWSRFMRRMESILSPLLLRRINHFENEFE
jgi:hypothetical protein